MCLKFNVNIILKTCQHFNNMTPGEFSKRLLKTLLRSNVLCTRQRKLNYETRTQVKRQNE